MLIIAASAILSGNAVERLEGDWTGSLDMGSASLKLVFHISPEDSKITLDSPDQGAFGIPGETLILTQDSVALAIPNIGMLYEGRLQEGVLTGMFTQGTIKLPLTLKPEVKKVNRPQTPQAPFPYHTEEVRIANPEAGTMLAGTLTIPEEAGKDTPVVVMVSGSGLQNRDEELFEHKPFGVIADYLARNGIATLRYDDRGTGESTGDGTVANTADFASDAAGVARWLKEDGRFGKIGVLGHSEGGIIAYMLASGNDKPDFIVSVAGPSVKGTSIIAYQNKDALTANGIGEQEAEEFRKAVERGLEYGISQPTAPEVNDQLIAEIYPERDRNIVTRQLSQMLRTLIEQATSNNWMHYFLALDPASYMKKIEIPAFIIYGSKDRQVPVSLNLEPAKRHAPGAIVKVYPDLNHLMQHADTGRINEYFNIEETFSPEVMADIADFIRSQR